jgi:hypothetical protein
MTRRLTLREVADYLGVSPDTIRRRVRMGTYHAELGHTNYGPTWFVELPDNVRPTAARPRHTLDPKGAGAAVAEGDARAEAVPTLRPLIEHAVRESVRREVAGMLRPLLASTIESALDARLAEARTAGRNDLHELRTAIMAQLGMLLAQQSVGIRKWMDELYGHLEHSETVAWDRHTQILDILHSQPPSQ